MRPRRLHAGQDLAGEAAAADRVERDRRTGRDERGRQVVDERRGGSSRTRAPRRRTATAPPVRPTRTMFTSVDAVGDAEPVEHLPEVGRRSGVHQRGVTFAPHRADHAERGQRVDEARRALHRRHAGGQLQALRDLDAPVLRVHRSRRARRRSCRAAPARRRTHRRRRPTPAPSLPTGSDSPTRPASASSTAGETVA